MPAQSIFLKKSDESTGPSSVDKFLENATGGPQGAGRLIFALDATASRAKTWDMARGLQGDLIRKAASIGPLSQQLVFFRGGAESPPECRASEWVNDPAHLQKIMAKVECRSGYTQIRKVLAHARRETLQAKVAAVVFVGDDCETIEDGPDRLYSLASELGRLETPVFAFQEGHEPQAEIVFRKIAELSHGAYGRFDSGAAQQLHDLLHAVAAFATGGIKALETRQDKASRLLLTQIRRE
jgi:hypothetical protein